MGAELMSAVPGDREAAVEDRYRAAALRREAALCCPVAYDPRYLEAIPEEVLERDYGCGDPSRFVRRGDVVLDLGSGSGKVCFIAAQIAGPEGRAIGIDTNREMLALARRARPEVARAIGYDNVEFRRGRIQDLELDLDALDAWLRAHPVADLESLGALASFERELRRRKPLVPPASVDLVVSNCVLNLVEERDKARLAGEIFRVLRPGGRIAISDIVSDEPVPEALKEDPDLWSGCVSGAFHAPDLLRRFEEAGFCGIRLESWSDRPFAVVGGIAFRSVTVTAAKPSAPAAGATGREVVYRGPWRRVEDESGQVLERGRRQRVSGETFARLTADAYAGELLVAAAVPQPEPASAPRGCCGPRAGDSTAGGAP